MNDELAREIEDPIEVIGHWLEEARSLDLPHPEAMMVATVNEQGQPDSRIVLLKEIRPEGLVFYTNYNSRKGLNLANNPKISANFFWDANSRQIKIEGEAKKLSREDSEAYWNSRPRDSQLAQYTSRQSKPVKDRQQMESELKQVTEKFAGKEVPCPEHWGGYIILPQRIEFWLGKSNRFHDRFEYTRRGENWLVQRLYP